MGMIIYVNGELALQKTGRKLELAEKKKIESILDGWGTPAFNIVGDSVVFRYEEMEGSNPLHDGVNGPLEELCTITKAMGLLLDGDIEIMSDWNDFDNLLIRIKDSQIEGTYNSEIVYATTEELIAELKRRGVSICEQNSTH